MKTLKLFFFGNLTAKQCKYPPKTSVLCFYDYIDVDGLFGSQVAIYRTKNKYYFKICAI